LVVVVGIVAITPGSGAKSDGTLWFVAGNAAGNMLVAVAKMLASC
jgi:hypothetical protein